MLEELLNFDHVAVQCHDNPDADAIASAYGLYRFFKAHGKDAVMFYGGKNKLSKPNLVKMLDLLQIPLEHQPAQREWPGLLVTVDCQYGAGNVAPMHAPAVAVIDHHIMEVTPPGLYDIRPYLGSCSTLVWALLRKAHFELDTALSTALFYGLFTDTGALAEVRHPLDRDLRDSLSVSERVMRVLKSSNLSLDDLALASAALKDLSFNKEGRFALISAQTTDANILGFVSDLVMQVDAVDIGVVYSRVAGGIKYSVRTVMREFKAAEIAAWIAANDLGSGGGHSDKAGGYISAQKFAFACPGLTVAEHFTKRIEEYLAAYAVLDCTQGTVDISAVADMGQAREYEKLALKIFYVPCAEFLGGEASSLNIRMLEGDITIDADADTYLMIGLEGEVYPISRYKFESTYTPAGDDVIMNFEYPPVVLARDKGERIELARLARACDGAGGGLSMAVPLKRGVKLFTRWDGENYLRGEPGDWLVWPNSDPADIYIVRARIFPRLYRPLPSAGSSAEPVELDYSGQDISRLPGCVRAKKLPRHFPVRFAPTAGLIHTLEGVIPYNKGDAIICGLIGEAWPVSPEHFKKYYTPQADTPAGQDGLYTSVPIEVKALRLDWPFSVSASGEALLHGQSGDWLVQYAEGGYGVVSGEIFSQLYELI